jgi:hypothetical protein
MKTQAVRLTMGRLAGTVQTVPADVAARLLEAEQAERVTPAEAAEAERIRTGDPEIEDRDPRPARGRRG